MGVIGGLLLIGAFVAILLFIVFIGDKPMSAKEKKEAAILKKRLEDPRIYDPETDTYITLEEAESGVWDTDDVSKQMSEIDKKEQFVETELTAEAICKELIREGFIKAKSPLSEEQIEVLERLQLLDQLDGDWGYRYYFENAKMVGVILNVHNTFEFAISIPVHHNSGHYIFKEKTATDRVLDKIRPDDDVEIEHYECFTIQQSKTTRAIENMMNIVNKIHHVEVEILPHQFFIKTKGSAKLSDVFVLLQVARDIVQNGY